MTKKSDSSLVISLFLVFSFLFSSSLLATKHNDEPPGYTEENWSGHATFKRIKELEEEGILNIKSNVRIRDNLNRLNNQAKELKEKKETLEENYKKIPFQIQSLQSCIIRNITYKHNTKEEAGRSGNKMNNTTTTTHGYDVDFDRIERDCLSPYREFIESSLKQKKYVVPKTIDYGSLGEGIGWYERNFGLSTTHQRVKEIEKEGQLDIKPNIRTRDNFNRARRQIFHLKQDINDKVDAFSEPRKLLDCTNIACMFMTPKPGFSIDKINEEFLHCFEKHSSTKIN